MEISNSLEYKLTEKIIISGHIEALTGISIGGSNTELSIGGISKAIIRNPLNNKPYIPGSSLKGKMRSLLELHNGSFSIDENSSQIKYVASREISKRTTRLFGNATDKSSDKNNYQQPSRVIVRDASIAKIQLEGKDKDFFNKSTLEYSELKTEVVIDRITSKAMPRQIERVPSGAKFDFEIVLNIFSTDKKEELVSDLIKSMQLVENDYLGGGGSRGSGQIKFIINEVVERGVDYYGTGDKTKQIDVTPYYQNFFL